VVALLVVQHENIFPIERNLTMLDAVQTAWVFGGMGSWNDLGFDGEEQRTYDSLSEELCAALNMAVLEVVNSSYHSSEA
jgi:hypothetical protein